MLSIFFCFVIKSTTSLTCWRFTCLPEIGEIYQGKVKSIQSYGAFVEVLPGKDGLLHVSEIDWKRVNDVNEYLKEGDTVEVKLVDIDSKTGKMKLSRKVLLPKPETAS